MSIINAAWLDFIFLVSGVILVCFCIEIPFLGVLGVILLLLALPGQDCLEGRECLYTSPDLTWNNIAIYSAGTIGAIIVIYLLLIVMGKQWTKVMGPQEPKNLQEAIERAETHSIFIYKNSKGGWNEYCKNENGTASLIKRYKSDRDLPDFYKV